MKKTLSYISVVLALLTSLTVEASNKQKELFELPETCVTKTSTITDDEGNVLYSATCTRCNEDPAVATIQAGLCAQKAVQSMIPAN